MSMLETTRDIIRVTRHLACVKCNFFLQKSCVELPRKKVTRTHLHPKGI